MPRAVLPLMILAVTFVACAGDESPTSALTPTPSPTPFPRGEVFDRTGDAEPFPGVAIRSDLVSGTIEVTIGGHVVFTVQFVPVSFDADTSSVEFQLDTD